MSTVRVPLRSQVQIQPSGSRPSPDGSVACLAIPPLRCELADRPALAGTPVALVDEARLRVVEVSPEARLHGIHAGMKVRDATQCCPTLNVLEPRPALLARAAEALVQAMSTVSPLVEEASQGVVFADLRGMEAIYPRTEDVRREVMAALAGLPAGLRPGMGVAGYRFTALVAALRAEAGQAVHVPQEEAAAFLAGEPVSRLPLDLLDIEVVQRLRLLGIERCGQLAALPRHAVEAQFGAAGGVAWLAAGGQDPRPLRPRPWERERVVEHVQAEPPLVSKEAILHALEQMLGRTLRHPRARQRFVRLVRLHAETERGALWEREQVLREPLGDRSRLWTVLRSLVEYAEFPGPLSLVTLELGGLTEESGRQHSLFVEQMRRREQLDEMVRHLKVRFGQSPIARVVEVEPWHRLPERRRALLEYDP
ncbi:MAG: DNA polymerase Y family protein [Dehalococcoidia bacterium]|nr:DNA polymerase Y family protein [Dehalococcoidia bacterium]